MRSRNGALGIEAKIRTPVKFAWYASAPKSKRHAVDDSRRGLRRRVFKDWVVQAKGLGTACTVRSLSNDGALLNAEIAETPEHLTLVVVSEKLVRKCRSFGAMARKWASRSSDTAPEFIVDPCCSSKWLART
jgi:hypothetical protein